MVKKKIIALIPARSGSVRIKNKNILKINDHPLIAYTITSAINSKLFSKIVVSTDSTNYKKIAEYYGAKVPFLRPKNISKSTSSDYEWVNYTLKGIEENFDYFYILRPTNPSRTSKTILRSWNLFKTNKYRYSVRGVTLTKNHPAKMWYKIGKFIRPVLKGKYKKQPYYNSQFTVLPKIYQQNACIEISQTDVVKKYHTITSKKILPFVMNEIESHDINYKEDFTSINLSKIEKITKKPFKTFKYK